MSHTVLIVEDDPATRLVLETTLTAAGIAVIVAQDGAGLWHRLAENPAMVILDLGLPDADGLELLRRLRQQSDIPVLIHSIRSEEIERIIGIEIGADDYLAKPCNMRELLARVRSLLRRRQHPLPAPAFAPTTPPASLPRRRFGEWLLDPATRELCHSTGQRTGLGVSAYALLASFLDQPFQALSREHLSRALNREYLPYDRIIDVHVSQIRRILGKQTDGSGYIKTLRSQGYIFIVPVEAVS